MKNYILRQISEELRHHFGATLEGASKHQLYTACSMVIRNEIMEKLARDSELAERKGGKRLYYLSVEFLMGRTLGNNLINLMKNMDFKTALEELGVDINELEDMEPDAGLGNGGLGRLAACFLDSLTTLNYPVTGCGIRYEYGLFRQRIIDGCQIEMPDPWLERGNVWEIYRPEEQEEVRFGGTVTEVRNNGRPEFRHEGYNTVIALPYDMPVTGYDSDTVSNLRLWSAHSPNTLDMSLFSQGDYIKATAEKELAEAISKVLYPEDDHNEGRVLRLRQHYFLVSATMQNIVKEHKKHFELNQLPDKVVIHINDTHPAIAIPELMRILMDQEGCEWDRAWNITTRIFAYTNHTIMGEALERWPVHLFKNLLPRIYMIINEINEKYCRKLWESYPGDWDRISRMAIIAYDEIRMANLCLAGCFSINGVSELHTTILIKEVFRDFYYIDPGKFCSITNGVTQRRWILHANPRLAELITSTVGEAWKLRPERLRDLEKFSRDPAFLDEFRKIKQYNKTDLANFIKAKNNIIVNPDSIFDVQIKRLHEYKRQLLNCLYILYLYNQIKKDPAADIYPRTFIFGAKASPGYHRAKLIIKLISSIADRINSDTDTGGRIKVVFMEDYRVSLAEKIIPAAEISKQISTAGMEASGTGNMKLMMNGALTIGTQDGANIEIMNATGCDNIYMFGLNAEEVSKYKACPQENPRYIYESDPALKDVLDQLISGYLEPQDTNMFREIYNSLLYGDNGPADPFMVIRDFSAFVRVQKKAEEDYRCPEIWWHKAVLNTANSGYFSSDRAVIEYNNKIWRLGSSR